MEMIRQPLTSKPSHPIN
jgi:hypothetical protein